MSNQKKEKIHPIAVWGTAVLYSDRKHQIKSLHGIITGSKCLVPTMFGERLMTVTEVDYDKKTASAEDKDVKALLEHSRDFRKCWTSATAVNKHAKTCIGIVV